MSGVQVVDLLSSLPFNELPPNLCVFSGVGPPK